MKFRKIEYGEFLLFVRMYVLSAFVRLCILLIPIRHLNFLMGRLTNKQEMLPKPSEKKINTLHKSINRVSKYAFWKVNCLVRSIVLRLMLQKEGYEVYLNLGLTKPSKKFEAHAWISFEKEKQNNKFKIIANYV